MVPLWRPWLLLGVTTLAAATQFAFPPLRPGAVTIFLFLCPGAALIGLLQLKGVVIYWVLSVALSLVLLTLAGLLSLLDGWSLEHAFWLLVAISTVGLAAQLLRTRTHPAYRN